MYVYVVSQKQDEATEIFGKDDEVRKITQGSFPSLVFSIDHINFVTVVVNIQTLVDYRCLSLGILIPINPLIPPFLVSRKFSLQKFPLAHFSNKRGIPQCHRFWYVDHSFHRRGKIPCIYSTNSNHKVKLHVMNDP